MKVLARSRYGAAKGGLGWSTIRSPAALPRMAIRGRASLSERPNDKRIRYYKGGLAKRNPPDVAVRRGRWRNTLRYCALRQNRGCRNNTLSKAALDIAVATIRLLFAVWSRESVVLRQCLRI